MNGSVQMKRYWLEISNEVRRQIDRVPNHLRPQIKQMIASLRENPRPYTTSELRDRPGRYRISLDDHRIYYQIDDEQLTVILLKVGRKHGPEFYKE